MLFASASTHSAPRGYLQSLFARFNERVPFETASKIVREAYLGGDHAAA